MPNPRKATGTLFETELVKTLHTLGVTSAHKPRQVTPNDVGDIWVDDDIVLQAKAYKTISDAMRDGVKGALKQAGHAKRPYGFAVVKKPRGAIADAYVVIPLRDWVRFLSRRSPSE